MKKLLLGTVGLMALGVTSASAADLAAHPVYKAPPPIVNPLYDWSGFYIGINGGWAQQRDCRSDVTLGIAFGCHDANGGTVGGQIGYRWQTGPAVFGLEAQGNWADLSGSNVSLIAPAVTVHSRMDAFGLFTGQIGYAWNNVLVYAKGGAAVTDRNYEFVSGAGSVLSSTGYDTRWSPTVGAGLEYGFAPHWSIGGEYDHIFEDGHNATVTTVGGTVIPGVGVGGDTDMVLGRLNYKFGGGAPLLAKY